MEHKILFAGPVGSGKTTAISSISDIPVVSTERKATDELSQRKHNTTVAMDYGVLQLGDGNRIHLYGAPGQERFDFMWDILSVGGIGLVLMLDYGRPQIMEDLDQFISAFAPFIRRINCSMVIGVIRTDESPGSSLRPIRDHLEQHGFRLPVFAVDARSRHDVRQMLLALVSALHPAVKNTPCCCNRSH